MNDSGGGVPEVYFIAKGWVTPDLYFMYIHVHNRSVLMYTIHTYSNDNVRPRSAWDRYTSSRYYKS